MERSESALMAQPKEVWLFTGFKVERVLLLNRLFQDSPVWVDNMELQLISDTSINL